LPSEETPRRPHGIRTDVVSGLRRLRNVADGLEGLRFLGRPRKRDPAPIGHRSVETPQTRYDILCRPRGRRGVSSKGTPTNNPDLAATIQALYFCIAWRGGDAPCPPRQPGSTMTDTT